jgi:hypothetical protein
MNPPPAVMVHSLAHARAALAPGLPVTLLSAPGAALYAGVGWWLALVAAATNGRPAPPHVLDCGAAAGRALEALRAGQPAVVLQAVPRIFVEIALAAADRGATLLPVAPPSLDLAAIDPSRPGATRMLTRWLEQTVSASPS